MKIKYRHYRVPQAYAKHVKKAGPPKNIDLQPYSRSSGFYMHVNTRLAEEAKPMTKGGMTVCTITEDGEYGVFVLATGVARCSMSDVFSYKVGRELALERAKKDPVFK